MKTCQRGHERSDELKSCKVCKAVKEKAWVVANPERKAANNKKWQVANPEKVAANVKAWEVANPERKRENNRTYMRNRRKIDPLFKLADTIRNLIKASLRNKGHKKNSKAQTILGCTFEQLQAHLIATAKFNYDGKYFPKRPYHVDHIKPLSGATTEEEINKRSHYTNLQLLYPHHNLAKSDKLDWTIPKIVSL